MNFINVWTSLLRTGGASYNLMTGECNPTGGYMVAIAGFEKIYNVPETFNQFQDIILNFLQGRVLDAIANDDALFIGLWTDDETGKLVVDLAKRYASVETAIIEAGASRQKAIYSCHERKVLHISYVSEDADIETDKNY